MEELPEIVTTTLPETVYAKIPSSTTTTKNSNEALETATEVTIDSTTTKEEEATTSTSTTTSTPVNATTNDTILSNTTTESTPGHENEIDTGGRASSAKNATTASPPSFPIEILRHKIAELEALPGSNPKVKLLLKKLKEAISSPGDDQAR